jgi:hypothetical protein
LALALAVSVKMSPALLVLVPLTERKWRQAAWIGALSVVIIAASCAATGPHALDFVRNVLTAFAPGARWHDLDVPVDFANNNSIAAFVARFTDAVTPDHMALLPWAAKLHLAIALALLAVGAYATRGDRTRTLGMAVALMVVAPTYSWEAHATYLLVPFALVLTQARSIPWAWIVAIAVSWAIMSESVGGFLLPRELDMRLLRVFAHSPKFVPMLVLWALFCFGVRRSKGPIAGPSNPRALPRALGEPAARGAAPWTPLGSTPNPLAGERAPQTPEIEVQISHRS